MKRITFKDIAVTITPKEHSRVELDITCPTAAFAEYRQKALKQIGDEITLQGFRKGHAPEKVLVQSVGEERVLSEMADMAIQDAYIATIAEKKLDPIGAPHVTITKIGIGSDLAFKIVAPVVPEIKLPDYKKIAKEIFENKKESIEATDKEVEDALLELRKRRAQSEQKKLEVKEEDLPPIDDAFAKTLGQFADLPALKTHLKAGILLEKQSRDRDKKRMQTLEEIVKGSTIDLPDVLIEGELDRMTAEFEHTLSRTEAKLDDYLTQTGSTPEKLRASWRSDAERRVKGQFVLSEIARIEKITPREEDIEKEVKLLSEHYKGADPMRVRGYVEMMLGNDVVFSFLEGTSEKKE